MEEGIKDFQVRIQPAEVLNFDAKDFHLQNLTEGQLVQSHLAIENLSESNIAFKIKTNA